MRALVVGAGAIGLTCAVRLAARGADVLVIDGGGPNASRAAAGMLAPLSEAEHGAHPRALELGVESLRLWHELGASLALTTFPARGATWIGSAEQVEAVCESARVQGSRAERFGATTVFLPDEAALDPGEALSALELALRSAGGGVRHSVVTQAHGRAVVLQDGTREGADLVVLATGLGAPDLAPRAGMITPAKGQLVEVRSALLATGETLRGPKAYAVGRSGDRVVVGASMEPGKTDTDVDETTIAALLAEASALSPALKDAPRLRAWAGVRPMSADWAPVIGRVEDVIVARGHSRNGWLLAPVTAEIVCALAFGETLSPLWAAFGPERFEDG